MKANEDFLLGLLFILNASFASGAFITDKTKLIDYPDRPIRQVMLSDKSGFIVMAGSLPFTYNMKQVINAYSPMTGKSYLNALDSSILKRLNNGNIAMICGVKLFWMFDDNGTEKESFHIDNSYINTYQCSMTEIQTNVFLISSIALSSYSPTNSCTNAQSYLLQVIEYSNTAFTLLYSAMICPSGSRYQISCESFTENQKYFCSYSSDGIKGKLLTNALVPDSDEIFFAPADYYYSKLFRFNPNTLVVFYMNNNTLNGKTIEYYGASIVQGQQNQIVYKETGSFTFRSIDIARVSDNMLVALLVTNRWVIIRKFYNSLEPNGPLIETMSDTSPLSQASIGGGISESEYGFLYSDGVRNFIILVEFFKCKSASYRVLTGAMTTLEAVTETGSIESEKIMFTHRTPFGITNEEKVPISLNKKYDLLNIEIGFNEGGVYEYTFILTGTMNGVDIHSLDCSVKFECCYISCGFCTEFGDSTDNKCIKCAKGYFFTQSGQCFNVLPPGYYVDTTDNFMKPCHSKCKTCVAGGTDQLTKCLTCKYASDNSEEKWYLSPILPSHCQNDPIEGYYIDESKREYAQCYDTCKTCSTLEDNTNHQCDICKEEYLTKTQPNQKNSCVLQCTPDEYFFVDSLGVRRCSSNPKCPTDYPVYIPDKNECAKTCKYDYYESIDKANQSQTICIPRCENNNQFYYLEKGERKCVDSCKDKEMVIDSITNFCLVSCPNEMYLNEATNKCITECPSKMYVNGKKCVTECHNFINEKQCVSSCKPKYVDSNTKNCLLSCSGYVIDQPVEQECVSKCSLPLIHDRVAKKCVNKCPEQWLNDVVNNQCVQECLEPLIHDIVNNKCDTECSSIYDVVHNQCISRCPDSLIHDTVNKKCVLTCDPVLYLDVNEETQLCVDKCPSHKPKDVENKKCLSGCPQGYYLDPITQTCKEIICKENEYFVPSKSSCVADCKSLGLLIDSLLKTCVTECPNDKPITDLITSVCMTQENNDKELTERIKDLDKNIKDLAKNYPSIGLGTETFKIYNSTDLDKSKANNPIHFGECEKILKERYSIPMDQSLLIVRWEPPKASYSFIVYAQDGRLLDLNSCSSSPVIVEAPVNTLHSDYTKTKEYQNKNINLFNQSDPFFTDICYSSWYNVDQVDLPLYRRQEQLFIPKSSLCFDNCSVKLINYEANTVQCDCAAVQAPSEVAKATSFWNQMVVICYTQVFNEYFYMNIGFLVSLSLILIQVGIICYFLFSKYKPLMSYLTNLHKHMGIANQSTSRSSHSIPNPQGKPINQSNTNQSSELTPASNQESVLIKLSPQVKNAHIKKYPRRNKDFSRYEMLNDMEYPLAKIYDNRSFSMLFKYYCIRTQPFLNAFFIPSKKRIKAIRLSLFFLDIAIDLFFNALFFSDDMVGIPFDFITFLPKTIYASLSGMVLKKLLSLIPSTVYCMRKFPVERDSKELKQKASAFLRSYKPFVWIYFTLATVLSIGMWYYVAAFCGVYQYTQVNWVIGSTISICLAQVFPILFALVICLMRISSLKYRRNWLYELQVALSPLY